MALSKFEIAKREEIGYYYDIIMWILFDDKFPLSVKGFCGRYCVITRIDDYCDNCPLYISEGCSCVNAKWFDVLDDHISYHEDEDDAVAYVMAFLIYLHQMQEPEVSTPPEGKK